MENLVEFTQQFPAWLQWLAVALIGMIPYVESHFATAIGIVVGVNPILATLAAITGNAVCMAVIVFVASKGRDLVTKNREKELSGGRLRIKRVFDKWGVPGVSLIGPMLVPSHVTSAMMVSFGANRKAVIAWGFTSVIIWGVIFAVLASLGVNLLSLR